MAKRTVKVNLYTIIEECIEGGVRLGLHRAHKHVAKPSEEAIVEATTRAIMENLSEVIEW